MALLKNRRKSNSFTDLKKWKNINQQLHENVEQHVIPIFGIPLYGFDADPLNKKWNPNRRNRFTKAREEANFSP